MFTGVTAAVLALRVLVGLVRCVRVAVATLTRAEGDDADVLRRGVVTVLAAKATWLGRGSVFLALTLVTLAPVDPLDVLHGVAASVSQTRCSASQQKPQTALHCEVL